MKSFLPISTAKCKQVAVEFLGEDYIFYTKLSAKTKQTIMLSRVCKSFYCVKRFEKSLYSELAPAEIIFYVSEGGSMRQAHNFLFDELPKSAQERLKKSLPLGEEVTDLIRIFDAALACQQAYIKKQKEG